MTNPALHEIVLHRLPRGRYRIEYAGQTLVEVSEDPEFDACRALLGRGIVGRLLVRRTDSTTTMALDIAWGAIRRTEETPRVGPRTAKWVPFDRSHLDSHLPVRRPSVQADLEQGEGLTAQEQISASAEVRLHV